MIQPARRAAEAPRIVYIDAICIRGVDGQVHDHQRCPQRRWNVDAPSDGGELR